MNMLEKRKAAMRSAAARYEKHFNLPVADRMRELLAKYPNVASPDWLSWEGARYTNVTNSAGLRRWLAVLTEIGS